MISLEMYNFLKLIKRKPQFTKYPTVLHYWGKDNQHLLNGIIQDAITEGYVQLLYQERHKVDSQRWRITEKGAAEVSNFPSKDHLPPSKPNWFQKVKAAGIIVSFINNCSSIIQKFF